MKSFEELNLSEPIQKAVKEMGFETPSPIQQQALPILLGDATDFIGLAATGTGKTAAFGIPLLTQIDTKRKVIQGLVLCPTRELALQVSQQINLLGKYLGIKAAAVYGGTGYAEQIAAFRQGCQIVVGTPGRMIDHIDKGYLKLGDVKIVILDEADEMISMGFKEDLETILESVESDEAKFWLFSATMSKEVRRVADTYLRNPQQVQVNRTEMLSATVEQIYYPTREGDKPEILCKIIEAAEDFYGLIFCQTKSLTTDLTHYLTSRGYKVDCLHGDRDQKERERTMQAFRDKKVRMLVCTDVAARGLDVKDVSHVVNYSIPRELDSYVHRIGRTARSGKSGIAISLVTPSHRMLIGRIEKMTKSRMIEGKVPSRKEIGALKIAKMLPKFLEVKNVERASDLLSDEWKLALEAMTPEEIVGRFISLAAPEVFSGAPEKERLNSSNQMQDSRNGDRPDRRDDRGGDRGPRKAYGKGRGESYQDKPWGNKRREYSDDGGERQERRYGRGDDRPLGRPIPVGETEAPAPRAAKSVSKPVPVERPAFEERSERPQKFEKKFEKKSEKKFERSERPERAAKAPYDPNERSVRREAEERRLKKNSEEKTRGVGFPSQEDLEGGARPPKKKKSFGSKYIPSKESRPVANDVGNQPPRRPKSPWSEKQKSDDNSY